MSPKSSGRADFDDFLRRKIAWEAIQRDKLLTLTESQKKEVNEKVASLRGDVGKKIRELYRIIYLPSKEGLEEVDMGILVIGAPASLDKDVFEKLTEEGKIAVKIDPSFLEDKYLKGKDYVNVKNLLNSFYNTPGELRIASDEVFEECVKKGVAEGRFGYGILEGEKPICKYFKTDFTLEIMDDSVLIRPELCVVKAVSEEDYQSFRDDIRKSMSVEELDMIKERIPWDRLTEEQKSTLEKEIREKYRKIRGVKGYNYIHLVLKVPSGKLSDIARMTKYLREKFKNVTVKVDILATEAIEEGLKPEEYREKITETIIQSQIEVEKEETS